jgi:hypothetical protein
MDDPIPPSAEAMAEALSISAEIIADIELSRVPLANAALKAARLGRLLNDFNAQQIFYYEVSGYPTTPDGVSSDVWRLAELAHRVRATRDEETSKDTNTAYLESIERLESTVESNKIALQATRDRDVSISSANPNQIIIPPFGNALERGNLRTQISQATDKLASRRTLIYEFATRRHYELKFSGVAEDVFSAVRNGVDRDIGDLVPSAVQKFTAIHENLRSDNPENWSNAVHSCRRILQDLADAVYPPESAKRLTPSGKEINVGTDAYINRLVCFAEDHSGSRRFNDLVGSHLHFLGDRLDAIFQAAQKGSHSVVGRTEANRYVVYTYMVAGDILSLRHKPSESSG